MSESLAKRPRRETKDSLDCSDDELDCGLLESSSSSESGQSEESQLDPELEADMEQYRKPDASYIELIAKAILESPGQKLRLQDIYDTLEKKYPYYQVADAGWRNSVRHNLSLHECFCKTERCGSGKGHYWSIHPIHLQDFQAGDFRRRTVKSRARQLHQQQLQIQQQKLQKEAGVGGALTSPVTLSSPPVSTILSPLGGQTPFHFPTPFGSPPGVPSPIPISPMLPTSPSLMYNPATGGIFYTAFPFPFMCGPGPAGYLFSSGSTPPGVPPPASLPCSSNSTVPQQQTNLDVPPMSGSLPPQSGSPPVLPPVCCINNPPTSLAASSNGSSFGTSSTLTAGIRSHIPHYIHESSTMQETLKQSPFTIDNILASHRK